MTMHEKITAAKELAEKLKTMAWCEDPKNDAANIIADSFDEYMAIWNAFDAEQ